MEETLETAVVTAPQAPESAAASDWQPVDDDTDSSPLSRSLVMMIDDESVNAEVVQLFLEEAGLKRFVACNNAREALERIVASQPDVLLLDLMMPYVSGFDILSAVKQHPALKQMPVIILTSSSDAETKLKALRMGATDFLAKPVDPSELVLRLENVLTVKAYQDHLASYSSMLEQEVYARTAELEAAQQQILYCLATAGEFRDDDTAMHVVRVGRYAGILARKLSADEEWCRMIEQAAPLHDVGKLGIPDAVLLKPGKLTDEERAVMERHCNIGTRIIFPPTMHQARMRESAGFVRDTPLMRMAAVIAETHHERWDGTGYPRRLKGREIPLEGRIVAVADVYDALSSARPYKEAFPRDKCHAILRDSSGSHFDPAVVEAFFDSTDEIDRVQDELVG